jgi:hypothetical protein
MSDSKFLLLWLLIWQPIVSAIYISLPVFSGGDLTVWWLVTMAYFYVLFAPAIYLAFFRKPGA